MFRFALPLVLAVSLVIISPAPAKSVKANPQKQTITLGQTATVKIKAKSHCRFISGLSRKRVEARYRRSFTAFTLSPNKVGHFSLRFRCASKTVKASLTVTAAISGDNSSRDDTDSGKDNGLEPNIPGPTDPGNKPKSQSRLGTNAAAVTYYDGVVPFSDLMMQAGDWLDNFTSRRDGYPASLLGEARVALAESVYPPGVYKVLWQGQGSFSIAGKLFSGTDGSGTVSLDGSSLVLLTITATNVDNPLHAIKVITPGETGVFRSKYLSQLAPYGIIRFMDWQRTNGTFSDPVPSLSCGNRTLDNSYSQGSRRGASVEMMVALSNKTGATPWFNIPHKADDSFITCLAEVVKKNLRADLVPRFEFSNETWNPTFEQYSDLENSALGEGDSYLGLQRAHARRHRQVMAVIAAAIGGRSFRRVMAGQAANSWVLEQRLSFENSAATVDEIAIAPYVGEHDAFDPGEASRIAGLNRTQLFAELDGNLTSEVRPWVESHVALANSFSKPLIAYEGGQHLAGDQSNNTLTDLFTGANRDARMGSLYDRYFALWDSLTGKAPFVHFTDVGPYTRFGSWGALETADQDISASPKYQALLRQAGR